MRMTTALVVGLFALGDAVAAAPVPDITSLGWLTGCWHLDNAEPGSGEQWMPLAGRTLFGTSRTIKQGRTVAFEFMQLRHRDDGTLVFIALPSGQQAAAFPALEANATRAVFENTSHDFPQRITYTRQGDTQLLARIEGARDARRKAIDFPMHRVRCDATE